MLELSKKVLSKVSFDRALFKKELSKSISWLKKDDIHHLKTWCLATFIIYNDLILDAFETSS